MLSSCLVAGCSSCEWTGSGPGGYAKRRIYVPRTVVNAADPTRTLRFRTNLGGSRDQRSYQRLEPALAETPTTEYLEFLRNAIASYGTIDVLEVGGGPQTFVQHPHATYTVLEFEEDTLATCRYAHREMIGDAQTFDFGSMEFDVVVFWNVLEHIPDPAMALMNVIGTVREGGLLIIRGPSLKALKALITRLTPHRFHVAFYKHILGHKNAGRPGHAPYVVSHSPKADADELDQFLGKVGFDKIFGQEYDGDQVELLKQYSHALFQGYRIASTLAGWLSFGAFGGRKSDFVSVYRKISVTAPLG